MYNIFDTENILCEKILVCFEIVDYLKILVKNGNY